MYVCIYIYIHTMYAGRQVGMYVCMHACMYVCMYVCMYAYVYVDRHACMYIHKYRRVLKDATYIYIYNKRKGRYAETCALPFNVHVCIYTNMFVYVHVNPSNYINTILRNSFLFMFQPTTWEEEKTGYVRKSLSLYLLQRVQSTKVS